MAWFDSSCSDLSFPTSSGSCFVTPRHSSPLKRETGMKASLWNTGLDFFSFRVSCSKRIEDQFQERLYLRTKQMAFASNYVTIISHIILHTMKSHGNMQTNECILLPEHYDYFKIKLGFSRGKLYFIS